MGDTVKADGLVDRTSKKNPQKDTKLIGSCSEVLFWHNLMKAYWQEMIWIFQNLIINQNSSFLRLLRFVTCFYRHIFHLRFSDLLHANMPEQTAVAVPVVAGAAGGGDAAVCFDPKTLA